jgi:hypothetical protein
VSQGNLIPHAKYPGDGAKKSTFLTAVISTATNQPAAQRTSGGEVAKYITAKRVVHT